VGWKKTILMVLLALAVLLAALLGIFWHMRNFVLVDMEFYPRGARQLDLRDQEITIRHYEKLLRRIPGCQVQWNVPFQESTVPSDAREITVSTLSQRDLRVLEYFPQLKRVKAEACTDYDNLLMLYQKRPDLSVEYLVPLGGERYPAAAEQVTLKSVTPEELPMLAYLPRVKQVLCSGGTAENISLLQEYCRDQNLEFSISLGGTVIPLDSREVTAGTITGEEVALLQFLPELQKLHIQRPEASAQELLELQKNHPNVTVTWEKEVCGQTLSSTVEEIDLSEETVADLETLEQELAYFPQLKLVFLGECGLDNDLLAAHRARVRDKYKLVWTVSCGDKLKTRTDATTFMPVREYVYYFNDEEAYNLRYCEDMVCIDIGHMSIHNIDFVEFMPNLEYLILAHTQLQYIEPIRHCKKLKFLELDWAPLKDLSPLKECTALEDLNLGKVYADFAPIGEMTWLKNLWMVECSTRARYEMTQALPDTRVMVTGAATVANGWRDLDNYYAMRDLLEMHYMSW